MGRFHFKLLAFLVVLCLLCFAKDVRERRILARIAVGSTVNLRPVKNCYHPPWDKGRKNYEKSLCSHSEALFTSEWTDFSISFIPEKDGSINLVLMGMDGGIDPETKKRKPVWVYFDTLSAVGAEIKNAGFEEIDKKGNLKSWTYGPPLSDAKFADSGSNFVVVWHNRLCVQRNILVSKGKKVTIKFKVRGALE